MTDTQNQGMTPWFEDEAKVVNDEMFWTWSLIELCRENHIPPRSLTEEKLRELWVAFDKMPIIRPILAKKILEYYWIQARELRNPKRVEEVWMTQEHFEFISRSLSISSCFDKFLRSNCWDRIDHDWQWTQYDKMIQSFWTPETASQKSIVVKEEEVDKVLIKRYDADIKRIESELADPKTTTERKEDLENSKAILEDKLSKLHEKNNAPGDWWAK